MNPSLGGYIWVAVLRDGTQINQFDEKTGKELSVDVLPEEDVAAILLVPYNRNLHAPISIEIPVNQGWKKFWRRSIQYNLQTHEQLESVVDVIGYPGGPYLYIYPDGSILLSHNLEH